MSSYILIIVRNLRCLGYLLAITFALSGQAFAANDSLHENNSPAIPQLANISTTINKLAEMAEPINRMRTALTDLIKEFHRQQQYTFIDPVGWYGGGMYPYAGMPYTMSNGQMLPPRLQYVDMFINQVNNLRNILQTDLQNVVLPDGKLSEIAAQADVLHDTIGNFLVKAESLNELSNNGTIGASMVHQASIALDDLKGIEEVRLRLLKMLKEQKLHI